MINEYIAEILGNKSITIWLVSFTFITFGVIVSLCISAQKRNKESPNTPYKFDWVFLLRDNISRLLGATVIAFSIVRFGEELFNFELGYFGCFLLGLCFDQVYKLLIDWQNKARDIFKVK